MDSPEESEELSWLELFVDPSAIQKSITKSERKKQLPKLCMQFTDKGFLADREKDKGKLAEEELKLFERKSASMRLCAMATFAALDYDIEYIIDNIHRNELQTLRVLADNFYRIYNEKGLDATFGNWLFYRFVLSIDRRNRLAPPAPRATIATTLSNGQLMPTDPALLKHEKTQRTVMELREHVAKARAFITEMSEVPRDVITPGIQCFVKPFVELAPKAMTAALVGNRDVLIECPAPDFEAEKVVLPAADVSNKCLSELVTFLFTSGELSDARTILHRVVKPVNPHPLISIDEEMFRSYCQILNVQVGPYGCKATIQNYVFDLNSLSDDSMRKSEVYRQRGLQEATGPLKEVFEADNAALSVCDGHPECVRERLRSPAHIERFVKVVKKKLTEVKDKHRLLLINAHLQYLCASIMNFRECMEENGIDVSGYRHFAMPGEPIRPIPAPTSVDLGALIRGTDPFWTLMTEYEPSTLKQAQVELGPFYYPTKMHVSDFLQEVLEKSTQLPQYSLYRILLSKLYQLSRMHNYQSFAQYLQLYSMEFGGDVSWEFTYESLYVKAMSGNAQSHWNREHVEATANEMSLVFRLENQRNPERCAKMVYQCLALLVNIGEHQIVFDHGGQLPIETFKGVPIARLLGVYLNKHEDEDARKKCADGFWRLVTPKFNESQTPRRRSQEYDIRFKEARKEIRDHIFLMSLIREPRVLDFILAFIVCLFNRLMEQRKKMNLMIHAKLRDLYTPDMNQPRLDITNLDDVHQMLQQTIEKAYSVSKTDPDTLRTYGDYLFTQRDYQGAARKYLEHFLSIDPSLRFTPSSNAFDDVIVNRLRLCTAHSGYLTMSLLLCQYIQMNRRDYYRNSMELLRHNETRDVGANCAEFVIDVVAVEYLSQHFYERKMTKAVNTLYEGASSLSVNPNMPGTLMKQEVERRTCKLLTALSSIYFGLHL